jgi:hypothetical protein
MSVVAFGVPMWGDVGGGWDVWLPLYVALAFVLVLAVNRWRLSLRGSLLAIACGLTWAWSVNRLGVIPAAAAAVLITVIVGAIARSRGRPSRAS